MSDTLASFAVNSGGEGGDSVVSAADMERVRTDLDTAQEEIVTLTDKLEQLAEEAITREKTIVVLEQLRAAAAADLAAAVAARPGVGPASFAGAGAGAGGPSKLNEVLAASKAAIINGTSLWKQGKREECQKLYLNCVADAISKLHCSEFVSPLKEAAQMAQGLDVAKAAVCLRKALDKLLSDGKTPQGRKHEEDAAAAVGGGEPPAAAAEAGPARGGRVVKRAGGAAAPALAPAAAVTSPELKALENELSGLKKQLEESEKEKQSARAEAQKQRQAAVAAGETVAEESNTSASLLSRAKVAERMVDTLKKQLAAMAVSMQNAAGGTGGKGAKKDNKTLERDLTMAAVEQRRLQRKIKTLEDVLKTGGGAGGGSAAPESKRAQIQAEKAAAKKFKDMENANKKQITNLERQAAAAAKALQKLQGEAGPAMEERESLRVKVRELTKASAEMEEFRTQAQEIPRLREEVSDVCVDGTDRPYIMAWHLCALRRVASPVRCPIYVPQCMF